MIFIGKVQIAALKVVRVLLSCTWDTLGQTPVSLWACTHLSDAACHATRTQGNSRASRRLHDGCTA